MQGPNLVAYDSATLQKVDAESFPVIDTYTKDADNMSIDPDGFLAFVNVRTTGDVYAINLVEQTVVDHTHLPTPMVFRVNILR